MTVLLTANIDVDLVQIKQIIEMLRRRGKLHLLEEQLDTLSERESFVFRLYAIKEQTFREISLQIGVSLDRTSKIYYKSCRKLEHHTRLTPILDGMGK